MATKTKKRKKLENRNTYIVIAGAGIFLLSMLLLNALSTMRGVRTQDCIMNMVLMQKAMQKMHKETAFKFDFAQVDSEYIKKALAIYMTYGKTAFVVDNEGYFRLKTREEISKLNQLRTTENYMKRVPSCPSKAEYRLIKSSNRPDLYDVECPNHGVLEQPNSDGQYVFSGDIRDMPTRERSFGIEAVLVFPRTLGVDEEFVRIVPKVQPEQTE